MRVINLRVPDELVAQLQQQAEREHRTLSSLIRHVLIKHLKENRNA